MTCTVVELDTKRDFEVRWYDSNNQHVVMDDVTLEIYHYEGPQKAQLIGTLKEPFIFTETINDTVNIASVCPSQNILIDVHFVLELNLIESQLAGLGCPSNNFSIPCTNNKVAIVNGIKKYALSACELSSLVNLEASGYTASSQDGHIVLTTDYGYDDCYLQVGNGLWNTVVGLSEGQQSFSSTSHKKIDVSQTPMKSDESGVYYYASIDISSDIFLEGERYYALFKGINQNTLLEETKREDFTVLRKKGSNLNISFIR